MVLVSILGDYHSSIMPIFFEFKDKITKHIIVYDDSKHNNNQLNKILNGQQYFLENFEDHKNNTTVDFQIITLKIKEDNYSSLLDCFQSITKHSTEVENIYLNATDGLSSISIVLSSKLLDTGANIIAYDRYANTYNLHSKTDMKKHFIKYNMDIKNHLLQKGYTILGYSNHFSLKNRKNIVLELSQDLVEYKKFAKSWPNHHIRYKNYDTLINKLNIPDSQKKSYIDGVLFEEYIYWLVKDNFDFDEVMTGVKVKFDDGVENEFDILMIKDNHLHTIECKFVRFIDGEKFVYKTNTIMDYLDDDGKAMLLVISGDNITFNHNGKKIIQFSEGDKARGSYDNIKVHQQKIFNEKDFLEEVKKHFKVKLIRESKRKSLSDVINE